MLHTAQGSGTVPEETVPVGDLSISCGAYPFDRYEMTKTLKILLNEND